MLDNKFILGGKMKFKKFVVIFIILLVFSLVSCATVPITGRKQMTLISGSQMLAMSQTSYQGLIAKAKLSKNMEKIALVKRVGERIALATGDFLKEKGMGTELKYYDWEFNLIEDEKTINAFCMPGGKIAVYSGILNLTDNEDQLAVVIGHEVAHAIAKHGNERMSQMLLVQLGGVALQKALAEKPKKTKRLYMCAFGLGAQFGVILPYSRKHEEEADHIGLILMAKAGYMPEEAVYFWQKMKNLGGVRPPEFMSTHPANDTRINNLKRLLSQARQHLKKH